MKEVRFVNVLYCIFALICILCTLFTGFLIVTGTKAFSVVSDSMVPELVRGDMVFCRETDFETLKSGDIITVKGGTNTCFTHRVFGIDYNKQTVTTKGDANNAVDPIPADRDRIVGKVIFKLPYLGWISILSGGRSYFKIAAVVALAAILLTVISIIIEKKREVT